ncbi:MAG: glycosyltransferase family 39 protein [Burkholderiales bacterium]|nr:glycosyltransferase family 39 protein [Flavobacterium sp.]
MKATHWLKNNYILTIILFIAAILRIYHADFQSIWLDEVLTMNNANPKLTLKGLYDSVLFWEFMPHLYFYLVRFAFELFGYSTLVARLFSAIIGVFGVYGLYILGKEIYNKNVGLIASLFLCVNYFHIAYSQEIRPYGLLFFFSVISYYRLIILIKNPTVKNAIFHGIFTGLIINAHFFGFITIFSEYLILLFFIVNSGVESRNKFFKISFISGIISLVVMLPAYKAILQVSEIKSFWLTTPTPEVYTSMFKGFFGNSEIVLFAVNLLAIYYIISLFRVKELQRVKIIKGSSLLFGFIVLAVWLGISLIVPLVKSFLDVSMITDRYFISIVAPIILVLAIGTEIIQNNMIKAFVIIYFVLFSITDLFIVKKYYTTPAKTQLRELTNAIRDKNINNSKIVVFWGWIFPYFFQNEPQTKIEHKSFEEYISGMRSGAVKLDPFWYADANARPFMLSDEDQAYLNQNFYLKEKIELRDAWTNYYVPKVEPKLNISEDLDLRFFSPMTFNDKGNMMFFENVNTKSKFLSLELGNYDLIIKGNSLPATKLNGENAHFKVKINGIEIGQFNLSENPNNTINTIPFTHLKDEKIRIQIIYDNDAVINGVDRNAVIYAIKFQKK